MHEGVDLPYDAARFQVIPIISKPYLGDSYNREILMKNPELYLEMTIKKVVQQQGRVCRAPDDWGVTYILDKSFDRLYIGEGETHLPDYFTKALHFSSDKERVLLPTKPEDVNEEETVKQGKSLQDDTSLR